MIHNTIPNTKFGQVMSHKEIADELGVSRSRVQQIEARALWKLRKMLKDYDYKNYIKDYINED